MDEKINQFRRKMVAVNRKADAFCEIMKDKYPNIWWCSGNDDEYRALFFTCRWGESENQKPIWKMNIDGCISVICNNVPCGTYICYETIKELQINVDKCLVSEIKELNEKGIKTIGCCCGHGRNVGYIQVQRGCGRKMDAIGYEKLPIDEKGNGHNCFKPKSIPEKRFCIMGEWKNERKS